MKEFLEAVEINVWV